MSGESDAAAKAAVFIDEADVAVDPTLFEVDLGTYAVAVAAGSDALPRARLGHLVAPLVGMHLGDKPSRAAPFVDLIAGWSAAEPTGDAVSSFVEGRLGTLPLHPVVSNPIAADVSSFRTQWHAATNEQKVAYSERERVTAWLLNPFVQRPPPPGRVVTALVDAPVFSEAAEREMRVLSGESVAVVGFRRPRGGRGDAEHELDVAEYVQRLRGLRPGDKVKIVHNGLGRPRADDGVVKEGDGDALRIDVEGAMAPLEVTPDRYPGFFVFPDGTPPFSKAGIARAAVSAHLTSALEFVLPTTSSEAARVALGDRPPRFPSRADMHAAVARAAGESGLHPPAFDFTLWREFPALQLDPAATAAVEFPTVKRGAADEAADHAAKAAASLEAAARARFAPMSSRDLVAAQAMHAAEVERGAAPEGPRVSLLSLKYGPPPKGAVVDLGFFGIVPGEDGGAWDPVSGKVVAQGGALEKLRVARYAPLTAEITGEFASPEVGLAVRHTEEHFASISGFGRDAPAEVKHSVATAHPSLGRAMLVEEGYGDAVAAPGDDESSPLDVAVASFLSKVSGDGGRAQQRAQRRIQGAHLIRTVVSYFAERQLRARFPAQAEGGEGNNSRSVGKPPKGFWLSPGLYAAMARAQDDADIVRDLATVLKVYIPAACKALIAVGAVGQEGTDTRALERRVDAAIEQGGTLARSVERVKDAMLSMERVLRGIGTRDTAAVRQVGDFPDERYAPKGGRRGAGAPAELHRAVEALELLRPAAAGINMVIIPQESQQPRITPGAVAAAVAAPPADVFGAPPPPPPAPTQVFDAPVAVVAAALLPAAKEVESAPAAWAEELVRANTWLFIGDAPTKAHELLRWLDARVSEIIPRSGLRRGLADRVMRAPQAAARHALSSVVLERLGPLLRMHRPQEPQVASKGLIARADPDTAVTLLMFVLVSYMARAGGQGPLVDDLNDGLEARMDAVTLNAEMLEDRFERMREDYRQENFGAMRAMDKADRAVFGELLVHRIVTVGDVREAAAAAEGEEGEGEEMVPVNREEYDGDDQ